MIARMAWRNLWRNRRRTIITLVSIAFGFLLSVTFTTLSDGSYGDLIDSAAHMGAGHVTIAPVGYQDKPGADKVLTRPGAMAQDVKGRDGVAATTVRIVGQAMVATAVNASPAGFIAIDPGAEQGIFFILDHIVKGAAPPSPEAGKVLIGAIMARRLELKIGRKLVLTTTDRHGEVVSGLLKVSGIFSTGVDEIDQYMVIVPIDFMRPLLGYTHGEANQVAVFLEDRGAAPTMSGKLAPLAAGHGGTALTWSEMMPDVAGVITTDKIGNYFFQVIVFLLVGAGILNTVLMGVMERMREFGLMLSLGMAPRRVWTMIMMEACWLAVVGLLVGAVISIPVYGYLHIVGIDFSEMLKEKQVAGGVLLNTFVRAEFQVRHAAIIFGGVFAMILAAGCYPAFMAAHTSPVKTMKTL